MQAARFSGAQGISESIQARIATGLMRARVPWPVALYIFCVVVPIWFQAGPLLMSTLRLFLLVMIVPLIVRLMIGSYGKLILTDILFFAHVLWMAVALVVNSPDQAIMQVGSVGMEFLGGYLIARAYIRTPEVFLALCRVLVVVVLSLIPFAILETISGRPLVVEAVRALPGINSVPVVTIEKRLGLERVQGVFAHPIHFGLFCSIVFSLAFVALKDVTSNPRRWITASAIAVTGFLALSSGALLAIILQIGLIIWAAIFASVRQRWWLLVGLFVLAWIVVDILSTRSPMRVFMSYATFSAHNAYWRGIIFDWGMANVFGDAEKGITGSPLFGIGMKDWVRPWFMHSGSMDNFWLVIAVRYGVPGFLLLALGYAWVVFLVMRRDFNADPILAQIRRAWVFTFLGLSFTLCTVHVWTSIYSFTFFIFGSGIWLIFAQPDVAVKPRADRDPKVTSSEDRVLTRYSRFRQSHGRASS